MVDTLEQFSDLTTKILQFEATDGSMQITHRNIGEMIAQVNESLSKGIDPEDAIGSETLENLRIIIRLLEF